MTYVHVDQDSDFSLHNIPFGVFSTAQSAPRCATRLGDFVVDLALLESSGLLKGELFPLATPVFDKPFLNDFMALGRPYWKEVRATLQKLFTSTPVPDVLTQATFPLSDVAMHLPAKIGDYTDYYSSYAHAYNVGCIIRGPENAIQPNWLHLPVGYHGRSSSLVVSGTDVVRPRGQVKPPTQENPVFSDSKRLDFELEIGALIGGENGKVNEQGHPIKVNEAAKYLFGFVLVNDWSARDLQTWEYVPLGPFNAKNFSTTLSPWVVTLEALEPFSCNLQEQIPEPLPYLKEINHTSYDIDLQVSIKTQAGSEDVVTRSNFKYLYWSATQQLAHHAVSGCNINVGDLLASGTISGPEKSQRGCMLELSWAGKEPITLSNGETRSFLNDGDLVTMTGSATKNGNRVGFGECKGLIKPACPLEEFY